MSPRYWHPDPDSCFRTEICHDEELGTCFKKYGRYREEDSRYDELFHQEFHHMRRLHQLMNREGQGALYARLFPRYYRLQEAAGPEGPCLLMEYLPYGTLEDYLKSIPGRGNTPHPRLSHDQILQLFGQLHSAISWLRRVEMIPLDLSPQNILVASAAPSLSIRLVDFTGCYYTDQNARPSRMDYHVDPNQSPALQLRDSGAFLFTRLFFSGQDHYMEAFRSPYLENHQRYFLQHYGFLVNCIFPSGRSSSRVPAEDDDSLACWEAWYRALEECLRQKKDHSSGF